MTFNKELDAAARWMRAKAKAEQDMYEFCKENQCDKLVTEYHRARAQAFVDAAVWMEGRVYKFGANKKAKSTPSRPKRSSARAS
jgi:hypothetical protein